MYREIQYIRKTSKHKIMVPLYSKLEIISIFFDVQNIIKFFTSK